NAMRRFSTLLFGAAVALLLPAGARADFADFSYNWNPNPVDVAADVAGSKVTLSNEPAGKATGDTDVVAANLKTFSNANPKKPATFTSKGYNLPIFLLDEESGKSGTLTFAGEFNGTVSAKSSKITNTFLDPTTQSIDLGSHTYTVTMTSYSPPGPPTGSKEGSIGAHVTVNPVDRPPDNPKDTPEPSTMVLAGLGLSVLGAARWRKRRQAAR